MMVKYFVQEIISPVVSVFSLAWFIVGILTGWQLYRRHFQKNKSSSFNSVELYIGNLSYDITEKYLQEAFQKFGKVLSVRVITNKFDGRSKGFGFIEMANKSEAVLAIRGMNNRDMRGRKIVVNEAKSTPR